MQKMIHHTRPWYLEGTKAVVSKSRIKISLIFRTRHGGGASQDESEKTAFIWDEEEEEIILCLLTDFSP
jgi:hypothetical protein